MQNNAQEPTSFREIFASATQHLCNIDALGLSPHVAHEARREFFLDIEVEGFRFRGAVGNTGPYLLRFERRSAMEFSFFGPSLICELRPEESPNGGAAAGFWVCAGHRAKPRTDLSMLSPAGVRRVAFEFGIPIDGIHPSPRTFGGGFALFYLSNAFQALQAWGQAHERKAAWVSSAGRYIAGWAKPGRYAQRPPRRIPDMACC